MDNRRTWSDMAAEQFKGSPSGRLASPLVEQQNMIVVTCHGYINVEDLDWFKEFKANENPGGNLKFYRTRDNLTQTQLAEKLGTTRQDVSGMERNSHPISKKTAKKLENLFKTSPAKFI